ncbi:hypothetical protein CVT24_005684 [Panaeolus cyanescens]|uniref:DUF1996 domain-containing protein n=1 Tax=Panaeolus cyanescens TaxID=181874 RepID=A0A409V980_9AGAR|nr:hypothetical protein CVT24_005684 [Panaeolus cyanescens]
MKSLFTLPSLALAANAYWLMGIENIITTERIDPVVSPGKVASHVHSVLGGSNFRLSTNTSFLRQSECSSIPIPQDKSAYWFPHLYFQWNNGSFSSLNAGAVIDTPGTTTAFPDDFRMLSGDPTLRTYDPNSFAQQAVTYICLDFNGVSSKWNFLPPIACPDGIRAQVNFPSCWDGKNLDSPDHKSHVAFLSGGPDSGSCSDPKFPVTLPRIFLEVYWYSNDFASVRSQARNTTQPFVFSYGDPTGYGYHADFINGWDHGVLQNAVDNCHCNPYGDATCCVEQGIFDMNQGKNCRITKALDEQTTGTLLRLPGNNPVQPEGQRATIFAADSTPALIAPIFAYTGSTPTATGTVVGPGQTNAPGTSAPSSPTSSATPTSAPASSSTSISSTTSSTPSSTTRTSTTSARPTTTSTFGFPIPTFSTPTFSFPSFTFPRFPTPHAELATPAASLAAEPTPAKADSPAAAVAPAAPASNEKSGSDSGTCSSKKRRAMSMEKHRRRETFDLHAHARRYEGFGTL